MAHNNPRLRVVKGNRPMGQPRLAPGSRRKPVGTSVIPDLERAIEREMRRYGVSRSFVLATCAAYALGVEEQADYRNVDAPRLRVRNWRVG